MNIFDELDDEHHVIARVTDAFSAYLDAVEAKHDVDRHELFRFVTFFSDYADSIHHAKEEAVLFPALEHCGYERNKGPLAEIRKEHNHERALLSRLKRAATAKHAWSDERIGELLATGRELVAFGRAHMKKEDELLFPEAKNKLVGEVAEHVGKTLVQFQRIHDIEGYSAYLGRLARELYE